MAGSIYRGYDIEPITGGFIWTDERGFVHYYEGVTRLPYSTEEDAMMDIDAYKRALNKTK